MALGLVTVKQEADGNPFVNVMGFDTIPETQPDVDDFADEFATLWDTHLLGGQSTNYELTGVDVSVLDATSVLYTLTHNFSTGTYVGGQSADLIPLQNALLVKLIHIGPKPNRGRIYFAGFTEQSIGANGRFSGSLQASAITLVSAYVSGVTWSGGTSPLRIVRRPSAVFTQYVQASVDGVSSVGSAATQRRRRFPVA